MPGILESDQRWPALDSASPGSSCASPPSSLPWVRQGTTQKGPRCYCDLAPWFSKCGTQTISISIISDLLEVPVWGPYPRPTEIRHSGGGGSNLSLQAPQVIVMYTVVWELLYWTIPAQSQREGSDESLQMGGTQVPTYSLTAGANTMQSLVGLRPEEWVGRDGCRW